MDQSESALVAGMSTIRVAVDWSSEFVTLTEVGPNLGTHTLVYGVYGGVWSAIFWAVSVLFKPAGVLAALLFVVSLLYFYDVGVISWLNSINGGRGVWINAPWSTIVALRGWAWVGCNGCSWGVPLYI